MLLEIVLSSATISAILVKKWSRDVAGRGTSKTVSGNLTSSTYNS